MQEAHDILERMVENKHAPDTDPALAIPMPDPMGRIYRRPGSPALPRTARGKIILPDNELVREGLKSGTYAPSITNVIGVLNKPYLNTWAAKIALEKAIEVEQTYPGRFLANPQGAIKYLKVEHERIRDAAAEKGTRVHLACEWYARDGYLDLANFPYELTPEEMAHVDSWKRWADIWQPEFLALEMTVFGTTPEGLAYAGTADFIAKVQDKTILGDIKTTRSGLHNELALQLTAVARAQERTEDAQSLLPNIAVDGGIGLHLSADKGYTVRPAVLDESRWHTFRGLRMAWDYYALDGKGPDGPSLLGSCPSPAQLPF